MEAPPRTVGDVLAAVAELSPQIAARAAEIETARRLPADLLGQLVAAGCFRLVRPPSHGGLGATLTEAMEALEKLASADGSVGWTVMIGAGSWIDLAGLPAATFDELFAGRPDAITAGIFAPSGTIAPVDGGYRVSGRWAFASGCEHADWLFGNCLEGFADGIPQLRIAVFAPEQVIIEDTWHVAGLRGTGSHHFHVDDIVVPAARTHDPLAEETCLDTPIVRIPPPPLIGTVIGAVALGIAQGALDDIVAIAAGKVPLFDPAALATNPGFQRDLAGADATLAAAHTLLYDVANRLWDNSVARRQPTLELHVRARAAAVWATERAVDVVTFAYRAGGSTSLYDSCPLQRRLRDIYAVTQHFVVKRDTLTIAGRALAGQDLGVPIF